MSARLGDDGTMDTVLVCEYCGAETRYTYDPSGDEGADEELTEQEALATYDAWVQQLIEEFDEEHECQEEQK